MRSRNDKCRRIDVHMFGPGLPTRIQRSRRLSSMRAPHCGRKAHRICLRRSKAKYPAALAEMLAYKGPYLLDVICPYQEHVLPMIPSGGTVREIIKQ